MAVGPIKIFNDFSQLKEQTDFNRFVSAWAKKVHDGVNSLQSGLQDGTALGSGVITASALGTTYVKSTSCGSFSTLSTSYVTVTNLSVQIQGVGRPIVVMLVPDGTALARITSSNVSASTEARFQVLRTVDTTSTQIAEWALTSGAAAVASVSVGVPTGLFIFDSTAATGTNTYTLYARAVTGTASVFNSSLVAYQI